MHICLPVSASFTLYKGTLSSATAVCPYTSVSAHLPAVATLTCNVGANWRPEVPGGVIALQRLVTHLEALREAVADDHGEEREERRRLRHELDARRSHEGADLQQ